MSRKINDKRWINFKVANEELMKKKECPNGMEKIDEIDACWEPDLSVTGNPMGRFYNKKGDIIAYSSYDYINRITEFANQEQREYFNKYVRK